MIADARAPGAYFRWQDTSPPATVPVRTDIAGFVGIARRGPIHEPVRVESWNQFTSVFGEHIPQAHLAYAVEGFFENGGQRCWVVRVADPASARPAKLVLFAVNRFPALELTAREPGSGASDINVTVTRTSREQFELTIRDRGIIRELWTDLTMRADDPRYVETVLNPAPPTAASRESEANRRGGRRRHSLLVAARALNDSSFFPESTPAFAAADRDVDNANLQGGSDGLATLQAGHFSGEGAPPHVNWGLRTLEAVDEIGIVAVPDIMPKEPNMVELRPPLDPCNPEPPASCQRQTTRRIRPLEFAPTFSSAEIERLQRALIAHCEQLRYRFAVLDFPPELNDASATLQELRAWRLQYQSKYAAIYFPWVRTRNPDSPGARHLIPPSGHVAGAYARVDLGTGVHKPAANEELSGASDVSSRLDEAAHAFLNEAHVNVIRPYPGRGIRISGARTLDRPGSEWRFVNVRRLVSMIERTVERDAQDAVFAPNQPAAWLETDRMVRHLLERMFRRGMLDGATAREAYYVKCDETTNTPEEIEAGRLVCLVGLQPPRPAEFIELTIGKSADATQFSELGGD